MSLTDGATYEAVSRTADALRSVLGRNGSYLVAEPGSALAAADEWLRTHPIPDERDYLATYRKFWAGVVETDGRLDFDKVARELHDWHVAMEQVSSAYDELTGGRLSKPNSLAKYVVQFARESQDSHTADNLRDLLRRSEDMSPDEVRREIREWADELAPEAAS